MQWLPFDKLMVGSKIFHCEFGDIVGYTDKNLIFTLEKPCGEKQRFILRVKVL